MRLLRLLTPARAIALLTLCGLALWRGMSGGQMFSPGELNANSRPGVTLGGVSAHADLGGKCSACHVSPWSSATMASRCLDCHADVRAQFDAHRPLHGTLADGTQCSGCHTEHNGAHGVLTSLAKFDHDLADFKLTGKHRSIDCAQCHVNNVYQGTAKNCAACHAEPQSHQGRFGANCAQCHSTNTWKSFHQEGFDHFDHDLTAFKLTGKHKTLACAACHINNVFHGTAKTCAACHKEPQSHKDRVGFSTNCASCHSTSAWGSAAPLHHTFPLDHHNKKQSLACTTCHTTANNFRSYTCYGCHAHELNKMERKHARLNVAELAQCARCHPNGREHKGDRGRDREREKSDRDRQKGERELEKWLKERSKRERGE
jgi:hypothetical protein